MLANMNDLFSALSRNDLVPCFQPIVELRSGHLTGFEVLARWQHPELGLILPHNFISLAETNGLIGQLTQQVLRKAFAALPLLPAPLALAINVSPLQLHDLTLPTQVRQAAEETGFPLDRLHVEIIESAFVDNVERAQTITRELKSMGCKLALDDFGTGYSSLLHLQAMPFDKLKVDRSFVSSMTTKRDSRKIVAAVVGLGLSLGLNTVAEGVETEEQADMLMLLGCELGQGWLYSKPQPAHAIPEMIDNANSSIPARLLDSKDSIVVSLEAQPAQRLAQLQAIYDGAPVCLCFLDRNLRYVSINRRFADMNCASVAAHIGMTVRDMVPEVYPAIEPYLQRALLGEAITDFEIVRPSKISGSHEIVALMSYHPAFDEVGEVLGISVSAVDITERKRAENELRDSDDLQRHMAEINHQLPWITNATGENVMITPQWRRTLAENSGRANSLGWLALMDINDLKPTRAMLMDSLESGSPIDYEYQVKSLDGDMKWVRSRGAPHFDVKGHLVRWYGTVEDIDERKQLELLSIN